MPHSLPPNPAPSNRQASHQPRTNPINIKPILQQLGLIKHTDFNHVLPLKALLDLLSVREGSRLRNTRVFTMHKSRSSKPLTSRAG